MNPTQAPAAMERSRHPDLAPQPDDDRSSHALRQAIGYLGVTLPIFLWILARARSVGGFPGWEPLDSISQYYHSGAVALLTGSLALLAMFLFIYRGFDNPEGLLDRRLAKIAGLAALGVSFFPTRAHAPFIGPDWWLDWMMKAHYASAVVLFLSFIVYSLVLFPKSSAGEAKDPDKTRRNRIYRLCGWGMVVCVIAAGIIGAQDGPIVVPEAIALALFGWSWLTKGRVVYTWKRWEERARSRLTARPARPAF